ncbi:MAG: hypothetical protein AAF922_05320 [Pseudomonadota bacterium]
MFSFVAFLASLAAMAGIMGGGSSSDNSSASPGDEPAANVPPDIGIPDDQTPEDTSDIVGEVPQDPDVALSEAAYFAQNGQLVVEAESGESEGNWEEISFDGETAMLWDANSSSYGRAPDNEAITFEFATEESGTYTIALHGGRMRDVMNDSDLRDGDGSLRTDTGNDVYIRITNLENAEEVVGPTKLYIGLGNSDEDLRWGSTFDPAGGGHVSATAELQANTAYKLEVIGRSDAFALDRITLSNDGALYDTEVDESPLLTDYMAAVPEEDVPVASSSEEDADALALL